MKFNLSMLCLALGLVAAIPAKAAEKPSWSNQAECRVTYYAYDKSMKFDGVDQEKLIELLPNKNEDGSENPELRVGKAVYTLGDISVELTPMFSYKNSGSNDMFHLSTEISIAGQVVSSIQDFSAHLEGDNPQFLFMNINQSVDNPAFVDARNKLDPNDKTTSAEQILSKLYPNAEYALTSLAISCSTSSIRKKPID